MQCEKSIKESLSALFNLELMASAAEPVTKANYIKELELRSDSWVSTRPDEEVK
jgi:hypothetical protein